MTELVLHPVIPSWAIGALLLAGLAGIWITYSRCVLSVTHRLALIGLRLAALAILAGLLYQPELLRLEEQEQPPSVAVLIDVSASMLDAPGDDRDVRATNLRELLDDGRFRRQLDRYDVLWYEVGATADRRSGIDPGQLVFNAPRTHLADAINEVVRTHRGANLAGIVLLSDGLDQSTAELAPQALRVPIFAAELAKPPRTVVQEGGDVFIADVIHPRMLVVNWKGQVEVTVKRTGSGRLVCPVYLYQRGERVREGSAIFEPGETLKQLSFTIEPLEVGPTTYRLELDPAEDEVPANNQRQFVIDVTDPKNRVLYLEGTARWDFKFIKGALLKEKNYHLSAFVQSAEGIFLNFSESEGSASLGGLPEFTEERLVDYRVIILGDMAASALDSAQQEALVNYVDKGGGLLFLGSRKAYGAEGWPAAPPIAKLLPFENLENARMAEGRFAPVATAEGRTHPVLAGLADEATFPNILSVWGPVRKHPGASSLIDVADGSPLLLVDRYGSGRVAAVLSDSLWRWQLGAPRTGEAKSLLDSFVSQLVYWLSPQEKKVDESKSLQLFTATKEAEVRQTVYVGAVFGSSGGTTADELRCTITLPDRRQLTQTMVPATLSDEVGLSQPAPGFRTSFVPAAPGEYGIRVEAPTAGESAETVILVVEPQLEFTGRPIDYEYLQRLAEQTGGQFVALESVSTVADAIPYEPIRIPTTEQQPLWNRAWILLLLLALFTAEWFARSKLDLV